MQAITQSMVSGPGFYYPGPGEYYFAENLQFSGHGAGACAIQPHPSYPQTGPVRIYCNGFRLANDPYSNTQAIGIASNGHDLEVRGGRIEGFQQGILAGNGHNANASHHFENLSLRGYLYGIKAQGKGNTFVNCIAAKGGGSGFVTRPCGFWNEGIDPRFINTHIFDLTRTPGYETETIGFNIVNAGTKGFAKGCSVSHKEKIEDLSWGWWFNRAGSTLHNFNMYDGYFEGLHCVLGGDLDGGDMQGRYQNCDHVIPVSSWDTGKVISIVS